MFTKLRLTPGRTHGRQVGHKKEEGTELSTDFLKLIDGQTDDETSTIH